MDDCNHKNKCHLADNGSCTAGYIYWCPWCGAISVTTDRDEQKWQLPRCRTLPDAQKKEIK